MRREMFVSKRREGRRIAGEDHYGRTTETVVQIGRDVPVKIRGLRENPKAIVIIGLESEIRRSPAQDHGFRDWESRKYRVVGDVPNISKPITSLDRVPIGIEPFSHGLDKVVIVNVVDDPVLQRAILDFTTKTDK